MVQVLCYNKGCGKKFSPENNADDACAYHSGEPIFHDAYKSWSCCKKKSPDFTEFLNFPGCTKGLHSNVKPELPAKNVEKPLEVGEKITVGEECRKPEQPLERPSDDLPMQGILVKVGASLKSALAKHKAKVEETTKQLEATGGADTIQIGAGCKNNTCEAKFLGAVAQQNDECNYHPGSPMFHEGMKFWTCCQKRTSEFDDFLKQRGCTYGQHNWMKPSELAVKKATCRYDWHQTGQNVVVSIFAKVCDPEKCNVQVNPTTLNVKIAFNGGSDQFQLECRLNGVIDPSASSVEYLGTKAEIKLRKRDPVSWSGLEFKQPPPEPGTYYPRKK